MRVTIVLFYLFATLQIAHGDDRTSTLGDYGHGHSLLHRYGVIDELLEKTGSHCCDGGHGGECRITRLRYHPTESGDIRKEAWLNRRWCPLGDTKVHYDLRTLTDLPEVQAVVCASKGSRSPCPVTYCAAANAGL